MDFKIGCFLFWVTKHVAKNKLSLELAHNVKIFGVHVSNIELHSEKRWMSGNQTQLAQ